MSNFELVLKLFLQLSVILATCRLVTIVGKRYFGQTDVVCEMIAGVTLGPSLLGLFAPTLQQWLFPKVIEIGGKTITHPSMAILFAMSQVGLVLYMFLVGLELNVGILKGRVKSAGLVSGAGILAPFILGAIASLLLIQQGDLFKAGINPQSAALYLGASMSITAFPMLARMLYERGIARTSLGTLTLAAGSMDDAIAWCLLAIVLASIKSTPTIAILAIGGGIGYVFFMFLVGKKGLIFFNNWFHKDEGLSNANLTSVLILLMLGAWFTDYIGIYAVFGAFILGAAMPRGEFAKQLQDRLEYLTTTLLLPIFFVFSGLNTQIGLVNTPRLWFITLIILVIAITGKGLGCMLAAKIAGENWRDSAIIGAFMNARGLMELIILNIGLEAGVITPTLFTIMVIMAIFTTLMCSPLVNWLLMDHNNLLAETRQ